MEDVAWKVALKMLQVVEMDDDEVELHLSGVNVLSVHDSVQPRGHLHEGD